MKSKILSKIGEGFAKLSAKMGYHSPEILIIGGIVGGIVTVVMACKATAKTPPVLEKTRADIEGIHVAQETGMLVVQESENSVTVPYTDKDSKKDLAKVYIHTGLEFAKIYLPAASVGVLSIVSILAGGKILRGRNVALAAAYATIDSSYSKYRERIAEKYGTDVENQLRNGLTQGQIVEKISDENGKEKKVKKPVTVAGDEPCGYARYYEQGTSEHWEPSHSFNLMFLRGQQNVANDFLRVKKKIYLNEVYEMLGLKQSLAGQSVGWIYDETLGKDNYIDFGIQEIYRRSDEDSDDFDQTILLDFNVDGPINQNAVKLNLIEG